MNNYFGTNLKYLREKYNISQSELSRKTNINQSSIARWEAELASPSIDNVVIISDALNTPLPDILGKDLRIKQPDEEIKEFDFGDVKVTLSKDGKITDKDMLEIQQFLLQEKIKNNNETN